MAYDDAWFWLAASLMVIVVLPDYQSGNKSYSNKAQD